MPFAVGKVDGAVVDALIARIAFGTATSVGAWCAASSPELAQHPNR